MNSPVKSRRGVTLAELMVSLALVAIVIVMVVSFALLLSEKTRAGEDNLLFQQDFSVVKTGVEDWMSQMVGKELTTDTDGTALNAEGAGSLEFQGSVLSGSDIHTRLESVDSVTFELVEKSGDYLLFCTVTRVDSEETYTFCVNPRVGDSTGGSQ